MENNIKQIDCVLIGYSTEPLERHLEFAETFKDVSAGYQHILANSARFLGKRSDYFDAINRGLRILSGSSKDLHYAKVPNLANIILANYLHRNSLSAEVINYFNAEQELLISLLGKQPKVVAITTTFYIDMEPIRRIVDFIRQHNASTKIVVGGPCMYNFFVDSDRSTWGQLSSLIGADVYVNDSQGEHTLLKLCLEMRKDLPNLLNINNLVVPVEGNKFIETDRKPENNDMNELAISWSHFLQKKPAHTVTTRTARSCAFKCAFCRYPILAGDLHLTDVDVVKRELDEMESCGVKYVMFIDDTFNIPAKRFKELCRMMIKRNSHLKWLSYFRCANTDQEAIDLMAEAGCVGVFLGIESGSQAVLKTMNKGAKVQRYIDGVRMINEAGIMSYASFIAGHPGETTETIQETINFICETRPTFYSMEPYYHDTKVPIAKKADEYGLTGAGYSWKHHGMDCQEATEWCVRAYETINSSVVVPLNNFDLWSIGYLLGEGVDKNDIYDLLSSLAQNLIKGLRNPNSDFTILDNEILKVLGSIDKSLSTTNCREPQVNGP